MKERDATANGDDPLEELVAAFLAERERGASPSIESFAGRLAGREREVRLVLEALVALEPYEPRERSPASAAFVRDAPAGGRLGPYRIVREVGRGGMGVVYEAIQEPLGRRVALKLLRAGTLESPADLQRFRREAELASRLDHPGVCTVYETGFEEGTPFIAMRFLDGETLARKIARESELAGPTSSTVVRLDESRAGGDEARGVPPSGAASAEIARVVRLIERAARALHAAHEAGVVHRDVKPGNIQVTREGDPVVVDFGLARGSEAGMTLTHSGQICGTPAYLAPEQLVGAGERPDRQCDVYALGVTLFECLTLRRPFEAATREALYHAILTAEPADVRALNPRVPVDLKAIVDTALEKDRGRRYSSAAELADDLAAFVALRPVRARPLGPARRLARAARRNPATSTALALTLLAVVGIPLGYAIQQSRARAELKIERDRADANYREARAAVEGLLERIAAENMEESPELQPMRRRILESALDFHRRFVAVNRGDPKVRRETAESCGRIGSILEDLGDAEGARLSFGEAIRLYDTLLGESPDERGLLRGRAHARALLAGVTRRLGRFEDAEREHLLGIADLERLPIAGDDELVLDVASQLGGLALVLSDVGREAEVERHQRRALELVAALPAPRAAEPRARSLRAASSSHLGQWLVRVGRLAEGEPLLLEARDIAAELAVESPDDGALALREIAAEQVLADLWQATSRHDEAEAAYVSAIERLDAVAARHPGRPIYRERLANLIASFAALLDERGRNAECETAYRRALAIVKEVAASFPDAGGYGDDVARALANVGWAIWEREPAEAERCYREALQIQEPLAAARSLEPQFQSTHANTLDLLGSLLYENDRLAEAEVAQRRALVVRSALRERLPDVPAHASDLGGLLTNLARTVRDRGDLQAALALVDESICWQHRALEKNPDHPIYRWFLRLGHSVRAETCLRLGAHARAAASARMLHVTFPERAREWQVAARLLALCANLARVERDVEPALQESRAAAYSAEAIACLRTAVERGWRDADQIEKTTAFDALRGREDFQAIVARIRASGPAR